MKTIQLSNLDENGEDLNVQLSGDMFKLMIDGKLQRYRLSRMDITRLLMWVEDMARRYEVSDRYNVPRYTGDYEPGGWNKGDQTMPPIENNFTTKLKGE